MDLQAGTICLIAFPFTDEAKAKSRPAMIAAVDNPVFMSISGGDGKLAGMNVKFLQITSKKDPGIFNVVVEQGSEDSQGTGLRADSTIRCWNISTIHRGLIKSTLGQASGALLQKVRDKLRARLEL